MFASPYGGIDTRQQQQLLTTKNDSLTQTEHKKNGLTLTLHQGYFPPPHPLFTKTLISLKITQDKSRFLAPCADNKQRLQLWKNSANSTGPLGAELREPQLQTTRLALFYPDTPGYTLNHVLKLSPHLTKLNARCSL